MDINDFTDANKDVLIAGGRQLIAQSYGITKASLETNGFLSAASFQLVLTDAAIRGRKTISLDLKKMLSSGKIIPAEYWYGSTAGSRPQAVNEESSLQIHKKSKWMSLAGSCWLSE